MATDSKHTEGKLEHHPHKQTIIGWNMSDPVNSSSLCEVFGPTSISFYNAARIVECWNQYDQLKEDNKILKDLCNEMIGALKEIDKRSAFIDNGVNNAGDKQISELWTIANFACIRANRILSSYNTDSDAKDI